MIRALRASRLWKRLFPTPPAPDPAPLMPEYRGVSPWGDHQISDREEFTDLDYWRWRHECADLRLKSAARYLVAVVVRAIEEA